MENDSMTDRQEAYHNATICGARPKLMIDCIARKIPRLKECDISTGRGRSARRAERDSSGGQAIF